MKRLSLAAFCLVIAVALPQSARAQFVIADVGAANPTPGPNDISVIYATTPIVQNNDGRNYYWDNSVPPGQTFTTGSNPGGYSITNLSIKTGGAGGGAWNASQSFMLRIYSVSSGTATLVQSYTATGQLFKEGDWFQWRNLGVTLAPDSVYAYTMQRGGSGWEQMANNGQDPYPGGQICLIPTAGGAIQFGNTGVSDALFNIGLSLGTVVGGTATLTDITNAPTPGPNDISQLLPLPVTGVPSQNDYGLNYYWDSGPGQTFTTPNAAVPWLLTNLYVKMGVGSGSSPFASQNFKLYLYSVSTNGATATRIYSNSYTTAVTAEGNWIQCSGLSVALQPNTQYAYSFWRGNGSWMHFANYDGNPYAGGRICLIGPNGGAISYGTQGTGTNSSDAGFLVQLTSPCVYAQQPTANPEAVTIYAGTPVTLTEAAVGSGTFSYQWQTDGGVGIYTNISGATSSNLVVDTTGLLGTYNYQVIVNSTACGSAGTTSAPVALNITTESGPILMTDTAASPNTVVNYVGNSQSFSAGFDGTGPLAYQWLKAIDAGGTGATAVPNATNDTLTLASLQLSDAGYYALRATNMLGSLTSSYLQLDVLAGGQLIVWQPPVPFNGLTAGEILTNAVANSSVFEAAHFGPGTSNIVVTIGGKNYIFSGDGTKATTTSASRTTGAYISLGNTTADAAFDTVLDQFAFDGGSHTVTLKNLTVGSNYYVQIFALDDRGPGLTRFTSFQDPNNNAVVSATYGMSENKYLVGTFTAQSTELVLLQNLLPSGQGNINALVVGTIGWVSGPFFTVNPASVTTYPARTVQFTGTADGNSALSYHWQYSADGGNNFANLADGPFGGVTISGVTSNVLTVANVTLAQNGWVFRNTATNAQGGTLSSQGTLSVVVSPPNSGLGSSAVVALSPVAYWPLNDSGFAPTAAYDAVGTHDGTYQASALNVSSGILGPQAIDGYPQFPGGHGALGTIGTANSWVTTPALNLNTNTITISMWVYPNGLQASFAGLFMNRNAGSLGGLHLRDNNELGYSWVEDTSASWGHSTGLILPQNVWSYVALVTTSTNTTWYLYNTNGGLQTHAYTINNSPIPWTGSAANIRIGCDNGPGRTFNGSIDEVAIFNRALSQNEVLQLATSAPALTIQPTGANLLVTWPYGTLLESPGVNGPWTTNLNTSPYTFAPSGSQKYFRIQAQ